MTKREGDEEEEEGDEGDEEEYETEEEEEEEEPKLKYQRLGFSVIEILKTDSASCMAVHEKFLALGTHQGCIHILDFMGNENQKWQTHTSNVNELSIDANGDCVASCSASGKVIVNALHGTEKQDYNYSNPLSAIAVDPDYTRKNTKQFCTGGRTGQLVLKEKGWFGVKDKIIHQGEGPIHAIKWRGPFIAFANDNGVKIFDCTTNQRITYTNRPKGSPRAELYRCNLCWEDDVTLLIGWADSVKIMQIREDNTNGVTVRIAEIIAQFQTDYFICGLAPFGEYLAMLAYVEEDADGVVKANGNGKGGKVKAQPPELHIITRNNEVISSDALTIIGFEQYKATDYRLDHLASESLFYIVSPKDIVIAKPRDLDDHLTWLIERKRHEEALTAAERNVAQLQTHKLEDIGEKYIAHLLETGKVAKAASECPKIFKRNAKLWETWIFRFAQLKQLQAISPYIPVGNPVLSDTVYEMVLNDFLNNDHEGFLRTISEWPHGLYNIQNIIAAVKKKLTGTVGDPLVMDALAKLYTYDKQFDKTLEIYLRLKRGNVFELIGQNNLFDAVQDKVVLLMEFNEEEAVKLLVANLERIPISQVVAQLQSRPRLLHIYLHELFLKDAHIAKEFHELQVSLYAEYAPQLLLPFLRQSIHYPLERALQVCEQRNLYEAMVFILGRMGNAKKALELLIDKIGRIAEAIDFVEQQKDEELWEDLITRCLEKSKYVSELLENIGSRVDPIRLIKRIPNDMAIIGLRNRLVKIIADYNLQMSLREGCKEILKADCVYLFEQLFGGLRGGMKIDDVAARCATCGATVVTSKPESSVVVFFCSHVYHHRCLKSANQPTTTNQPATANQPTPSTQATNQPAAAPNQSLTTSTDAFRTRGGTTDELLWCQICMNMQNKAKGSKGGRMLGNRKKM